MSWESDERDEAYEKLAAIRHLAESWHKGYGVTPPPTVDDMDVAYDDAAYQILAILNEETTDFYGRPWSPFVPPVTAETVGEPE